MTIEQTSVVQWLKSASSRLIEKTETPLADSRVILADHLGKDTAWLAAHPEYWLSENILEELEIKITQLETGKPLPYILGWWEFFGLRLKVTPEVLIPRPETELLVETAISWLVKHPYVHEVWDIGTGSGCIALALVSQLPDLIVHGVDISQKALDIAGQNINTYHAVDHVILHHSDLFSDISTNQIQLLCANLPYIPSKDVISLKVAKYEPNVALDGGEDGLKYIERLLNQLKGKVVPPYLLLFEIEYRQAEKVRILASKMFEEASINILFDLAGNSRVVCVEGFHDNQDL